MIASVIVWLEAHLYLPRMLHNLFERIEQMEAALFHGQTVKTVYVPDGMSTEVAWRHVRDRMPLSDGGRKAYVLIDARGNMLKELS